MKVRHFLLFLSPLALLLLLYQHSFGWGFFAHKWINRVAVETLPVEIRAFFESNKTYLSEHAIDPDLWRRDDPNEQYRHYIDIDMYGAYPFVELPRSLEMAEKKFGEEAVLQRGTGPWRVVQSFEQLVEEMQKAYSDSLLLKAAALGHYVADLHMPLHTVENYDGKLTGNAGIHARFERWMIEKYAEQMTLSPTKVSLIDDPLTYIFDVVLESTKHAEAILRADNKAKAQGKVYEQPEDYDHEYYELLSAEIGPLAEKRMSEAVTAVASFWFSAWIKAGRPKLLPKTTD